MGFRERSLPLPSEGDPFLIHLCRQCMSPDPSQRPSFPSIVQVGAEQPAGFVSLGGEIAGSSALAAWLAMQRHAMVQPLACGLCFM